MGTQCPSILPVTSSRVLVDAPFVSCSHLDWQCWHISLTAWQLIVVVVLVVVFADSNESGPNLGPSIECSHWLHWEHVQCSCQSISNYWRVFCSQFGCVCVFAPLHLCAYLWTFGQSANHKFKHCTSLQRKTINIGANPLCPPTWQTVTLSCMAPNLNPGGHENTCSSTNTTNQFDSTYTKGAK